MTLDRWLSFSKTILSWVIDSLLTSKFDIKTVNDINRLVKDFINIQDSLTKQDLSNLVNNLKTALVKYQDIILNGDDDQFYLENSYDLLSYLVKDLTKLAGETNDKN